MHVAGQAPAHGVAAGLWQEENGVVFAIFEDGILGFVEVMPSPETVLDDLHQALMSAELVGAPSVFAVVMLDPALDAHRDAIAALFGAPVETLRLEELPAAKPREAPVDLTLDQWRTALVRREQMRLLQARLAVAGMAYAALLLLALLVLGILTSRLHSIEKDLALARPQVDTVIAQQSRWKSLAPAIDPTRYTVEMLFQVFQSLPSSDVRITQFDQSPTDFRVQGEAPDAAQAIALEEKLKGKPSLSDYQFEAGNPILLPNEHAQFSISGKL